MSGSGRQETRLKGQVSIALDSGHSVLIDRKDLVWAQGFKWHVHKAGNGLLYARTTFPRKLYMHDLLVGGRVDHKNGNGLDNRRDNLRRATRSQNAANSKKRTGTISEFRGVTWDKQRSKWVAQIAGRRLGRYATERQAARAYDLAAIRAFGVFARLNLPNEYKEAA